MQSTSLTPTRAPSTPIVPPPRLRRAERSRRQLNAKHAEALLNGILQPRDLNILNAVWTFGLMTAGQIRRLFFFNHASLKSAQNVMRRRLRVLYNEYCLDRWYFSIHRDAVYRLDVQGARILRAQHGNINWKPIMPSTRQLFLMPHTLEITEFAVRLTESIREKQGTIDWVGETTLTLKLGADEYFEPDGAVRVCIPNMPSVSFFLEWDRGTEQQSVFIDKMRRYRRYHLTGDWRTTFSDLFTGAKSNVLFPPMLIITTGGKTRMTNIIGTVQQYLSRWKILPDDQPVFVTGQALLEQKGVLGDVYFQVGKATPHDIIWETGVSILDISTARH